MQGKKMVLVACEFSGVVRQAFARRGWSAWSCDLLPTEQPPRDKHYQFDVRELEGQLPLFDLLIAFPPCTYLTNSGVRWLITDPGRMKRLEEAAELFRFLLTAPTQRIAIENPIPHKYAVEKIGRKYDQIIQPWQFGHGETKATCLWLKNLPPLQPTNIVEGREPRVHHASPGPNRWKERSRTLTGIAEAMADQWTRSEAHP